MNSWTSTKEIINKKYRPFLEVGKRYRKWMVEHKYVDTNMGFLKKEWISQGYKLKALSGSKSSWLEIRGKKYPYYTLIVYGDIEEIETVSGEGRVKKAIKKKKYNIKQFEAWQEWVEMQQEMDEELKEFTKWNMGQYRDKTAQIQGKINS